MTTLPVATAGLRWRPRSALALGAVSLVGLVSFGWPLLATGSHQTGSVDAAHSADAPWVFILVLPMLLAIVLAELGEGGMDAKSVALLGVLVACGAALRPLGGGVTGASPVFFLLLPAGRVLGRGFGFVLGALTLFASALLTSGVGPWLPFQMLAAAWIGFFAGCLPPARGRFEVVLVASYGVVAGLLYGAVMDLWFWPFETSGLAARIAYQPGAGVATQLHHFWAFYLSTSLGFDVPRALTNLLLVLIAGRAVMLALRRAARRASFDVPAEFGPAGHDGRITSRT
jgi:energy-coupling factor transport system substrate-specific component